MSDAKYTPGPWKVVRNSRNCTLNVVSAPDADGESVKIALVNYQDEGNANLIAAAPDMRDEITRLRAANEKLREALIDATASLVASVSLLERGGKKAAPSDNMFSQMLVDYKNSIDRARAALEGVTEPASPWRDIESAPKDQIILVVSPFYDKSASTKIVAAFLSEGGWLYAEGFEADPEGPIPTHWMPLPEPPSND